MDLRWAFDVLCTVPYQLPVIKYKWAIYRSQVDPGVPADPPKNPLDWEEKSGNLDWVLENQALHSNDLLVWGTGLINTIVDHEPQDVDHAVYPPYARIHQKPTRIEGHSKLRRRFDDTKWLTFAICMARPEVEESASTLLCRGSIEAMMKF